MLLLLLLQCRVHISATSTTSATNLEHEVVCWHAETSRTAARAAAAASHADVPTLSSQHQSNVIPAAVQANEDWTVTQAMHIQTAVAYAKQPGN